MNVTVRSGLQNYVTKSNDTITQNSLLTEGDGTIAMLDIVEPNGFVDRYRVYQEGTHQYLLVEGRPAGGEWKMVPSFHHF